MDRYQSSDMGAKLSAAAAQQCNTAGIGGTLRGDLPARESLLGRIRNQRSRAQMEARRMEHLFELEHLLEKNPEVARILDLLDEVRG